MTSYLFNGSCLLICWLHQSQIQTKSQAQFKIVPEELDWAKQGDQAAGLGLPGQREGGLAM